MRGFDIDPHSDVKLHDVSHSRTYSLIVMLVP